MYLSSRRHPAVIKYTQLTDFTDSASTPALSPDGHILAFIRGDSDFMSADQIYAKVLPDGEARRLTNDSREKYGLAFSPDGSQIAYTVMEAPRFRYLHRLGVGRRLASSAAQCGGTLLARPGAFSLLPHALGSASGSRDRVGNRRHYRELYFPPHERGMAHYSYASPDRTSALVVEMNGTGKLGAVPAHFTQWPHFRPDRSGQQGACTSAGWAPDGSWMYFIATVEGQSHLWRQRFPNGRAGANHLWPHRKRKDWRWSRMAVLSSLRSACGQAPFGFMTIRGNDPYLPRERSSRTVSPPSFSADDKALYYLLRRPPAGSGPELWRMTVDSGKSEAVFPGISMFAYDVSPDDKQVVYATAGRDGKSQLWLAPIDRSSAPKQIGHSGETTPYFGPRGKILFQIGRGKRQLPGGDE